MDSKSKSILVAEVGRLHAIVAGVERALSGRPATLESEAARQVAALVVERDELRATVARISGGMVPLNGAARACSPDIETEIRHLRAELAAVQAAFDMEGAPEHDTVSNRPLTSSERVGALLGMWQEAVYRTICAMVPDPDRIDGAGSDAGALELTLAEVSQGLAQVIDQRDELEAALDEARLTLAAEQGAPNFAGMDWMDDVKVWRSALLRLVGGRTDHLRAIFGETIERAAVVWGDGDSARWDNLSAPEQAHWVADHIERAAMQAADAAEPHEPE